MDNGEVLQCPAKSTKAPIDSGYESLAEHFIKFHELGQMPVQLDIKADFQSGLRTLESLFTNFVLFHVRCHKM